jgi:hypothetical protein
MDFYDLARPIQDRFLASASGAGVPARILFEPASEAKAFGWLVLAGLSPILLLLLLGLGFGDLTHPFALQPAAMVVIHAGLAALAGVGIAGYVIRKSRASRFPFRLGTYVFPVGVVQASGGELELHAFSGLTGVERTKGGVTLRFGSGTFRFTLPKETNLAEFERWVEESKQKHAAALASQNRRDLAVLDPLRDSGFSNPLSSSQPHQRPKEMRSLRLGAAILVGALIGTLLFFARNKLAERVIYKAAVDANSVQGYEAYLARGGKRPDVEQTLLPLAELANARGSLDAVEKYAAEHADSAIQPQIDAALREEMLTALSRVREDGSLAAIEAFQKAHPQHAFVAAELQAARKAVYQNAIKTYQETSKASPEVKDFFVGLIKHSEKKGPVVEIRFRRDLPKSTEIADSSIRKSAYYTGPSALPSQYFGKEHSAPREAEAGQKIAEGLQAAFSKEILEFVVGEPLEGEGDLPATDKPTLFITHRPEMSGGYTTQRPRGVYVGIGFMVFTSFVAPGKEPLEIKKLSWWLPPDVNQIWADKLNAQQIYDQAGREGFRRYVEKLLLTLNPQENSAAVDGASQPATD